MMEQDTCIFCKIVRGELPSSTVYEDKEVLAFLDVHPVNTGQAVVIPKTHINHFSDLPEKLAQKVFSVAHKFSKNIRSKLSSERVGLVVHGYGVPHAHMLVIPQTNETDITSGKMARIENGKVMFTMDNLPLVPREDLDKTASLLKLN